MNKYYRNDGERVLITDENGKIRTEINVDNIETRLVLENEIEKNKSLEEKQKNILESKKSSIKDSRKIELTAGICLVGGLALASYLMKDPEMANAACYIQGGSISFAAGLVLSTIMDKPKRKEVKYHKNKIKNFQIMRELLEEDLTLEKEKSKAISRKGPMRDISKLTFASEEAVDDYTRDIKKIKNNYRLKKKVNLEEYSSMRNEYFTRMMEKEEKRKQKSLTK